MSLNYNDLLRTAYEIEGLLSLQSQRPGNTVAEVDRMIAEKVALLAQAFPLVTDAEPQKEAQKEPENEVGNEAENKAENEAIAASALEEEKMMAEEPVAAPAKPETKPEAEPAAKPETKPEAEAETPVVNDTIDTPLSLEEKLARERARDIFRAFTLNDKFRFRRELFRDSQEEFDETLGVISQMSTIAEAEEYIYDDLCWDPSDEDVKAFMDVVTRHF